eukprot:TRINITY_DN103698_c0_g1_i1.p1 TRINITY_DN103698_c0_g1~~TRINITY_DN103698_c0_g1_i1.p1  ORF type:complete len:340 (-),score=12.97 TRINITY_DN103698_c0_g1_i1:83-1075(-)
MAHSFSIMTSLRVERPLFSTCTLGVALSASLLISCLRLSGSWQQLRQFAARLFLVDSRSCSRSSEAAETWRRSRECSPCVFEDIHAAVGLLICSHLTLSDVARLRQSQRDLENFEPNRLLSQLMRMKLYSVDAGLGTCKGAMRAVPALSFGEIVQACFNEAACCDGSLHAVLRTPDAQGRAPVQSAVQMSLHTALRALLTLGAPADVGGAGSQFSWSPLMHAVSKADDVSASLLVAHGASVNFVETQNQWTPLMVAVANNHLWMVEWLLDRGADPQATYASLRKNQVIDDGCMDASWMHQMLEEIIVRRRIEGRGLKHYASHGARGLGRA